MDATTIHHTLEAKCHRAYHRHYSYDLYNKNIIIPNVSLPFFWFTVSDDGIIQRWAIETKSNEFEKRASERYLFTYHAWLPEELGLHDMRILKKIFQQTIGLAYPRL